MSTTGKVFPAKVTNTFLDTGCNFNFIWFSKMEGVSILLKEFGIVVIFVAAFYPDTTYGQAPNASAIEIGTYSYYH